MKLLIKNQKGLVIPTKANANDACYDVVATTPPHIVGTNIKRPIDGLPLWSRIVFIEYGTNLFVAPESFEIFNSEIIDGQESSPSQFVDYHLKFYPRSSISKHNLVLANSVGTIDNGYRAEIKLRFKYIFAPEDMIVLPEAGGTRVYGVLNKDNIYQQGDKIAQFEICQNQLIQFEVVEELPESQRGLGGFGSSGN